MEVSRALGLKKGRALKVGFGGGALGAVSSARSSPCLGLSFLVCKDGRTHEDLGAYCVGRAERSGEKEGREGGRQAAGRRPQAAQRPKATEAEAACSEFKAAMFASTGWLVSNEPGGPQS